VGAQQNPGVVGVNGHLEMALAHFSGPGADFEKWPRVFFVAANIWSEKLQPLHALLITSARRKLLIIYFKCMLKADTRKIGCQSGPGPTVLP
jgi:hypothetical protein